MNTLSCPPRSDLIKPPAEHELAFHDDQATWLAERFKALADPQRLKILHLLMTRPSMCVCEIIEVLHLTQSNMSFHLNTLKHAQFIRSQKVGKWGFYSLNRQELEKFGEQYSLTFDFGKWPEREGLPDRDTRVCECLEDGS